MNVCLWFHFIASQKKAPIIIFWSSSLFSGPGRMQRDEREGDSPVGGPGIAQESGRLCGGGGTAGDDTCQRRGQGGGGSGALSQCLHDCGPGAESKSVHQRHPPMKAARRPMMKWRIDLAGC